jgi:3-hydroxybutyrate dehydrogenase
MLKGRTAVITGSTSGIGLSIAEGLASAGCNIVLNGLGDAQTTEAVRQSIEKAFNVKAAYHPADMSDCAAIENLIAHAVDIFGSVDVLVNNAGIQHTAAVEEFPVDKWDSIIAINLSSVFHNTRCAVPHMKKRNWGRIINIASVHGLVASTHKAAYVAAKHGVVGLTKVVALELAESGITCNAICPGWVRTPLVEAQIAARADSRGIELSEAAGDLLSEKQPSKRFVETSEIAQLCLFLAGDAARNITGVTLPIDGGWVAR